MEEEKNLNPNELLDYAFDPMGCYLLGLSDYCYGREEKKPLPKRALRLRLQSHGPLLIQVK